MRYIVMTVGCLECASYGDEMAEVILQTDDLEEAKTCADIEEYPGQEVRVLLDVQTGKVLQSKK